MNNILLQRVSTVMIFCFSLAVCVCTENIAISVFEKEGCKDITDMSRDEAYTEALHKISVIHKKAIDLGIHPTDRDYHLLCE